MGRSSIRPTLDSTGTQVPLLLVDGHNLLWGATFGFPAPIYSRDKTRLLTGLFAFFALLRVAIRDDIPGAAPEVIVVFDGEHGAVSRQQIHDGYKASRPADDEAMLPLQFLADVKRGLDQCGIAWIELEYAEAGQPDRCESTPQRCGPPYPSGGSQLRRCARPGDPSGWCARRGQEIVW